MVNFYGGFAIPVLGFYSAPWQTPSNEVHTVSNISPFLIRLQIHQSLGEFESTFPPGEGIAADAA